MVLTPARRELEMHPRVRQSGTPSRRDGYEGRLPETPAQWDAAKRRALRMVEVARRCDESLLPEGDS